MLVFGHTHKPWVREIEGVLFVNDGSVGKPKDGDPRAAWALLTVEPGKPVQVEIRRVPYDVASMAAAIRAADGLPDHFAARHRNRRSSLSTTEPKSSFTARGKMKRTIESMRVERRYRNVIDALPRRDRCRISPTSGTSTSPTSCTTSRTAGS